MELALVNASSRTSSERTLNYGNLKKDLITCTCLLAILSCQCQTQGERSLIQTDNVLHATTQLKLIEANTSVTTIPTKVTKQYPMIVTFISLSLCRCRAYSNFSLIFSFRLLSQLLHFFFISLHFSPLNGAFSKACFHSEGVFMPDIHQNFKKNMVFIQLR